MIIAALLAGLFSGLIGAMGLGGGAVLRQVPPQAKRVFDAAGIFRIIPLEEGGSSDEGKTE